MLLPLHVFRSHMFVVRKYSTLLVVFRSRTNVLARFLTTGQEAQQVPNHLFMYTPEWQRNTVPNNSLPPTVHPLTLSSPSTSPHSPFNHHHYTINPWAAANSTPLVSAQIAAARLCSRYRCLLDPHGCLMTLSLKS